MTDQTSTNGRTAAAIQGRRADTTRRRERVLAALSQAQSSGLEISVGAIARAASVDRTFLYRHRDLLAANERAPRLASHIRRRETRLSEALGEDVW